MDDSEKLANDYLGYRGFHNIAYEPDGNIPPDFLVDGRIAVEVRRLNQNEATESGFCGLKEIGIRTQEGISKLLAAIGPAASGESWFVFYKFNRPLPNWKQVKPTLRRYLEEFRGDEGRRKTSWVPVGDGLEVKLLPTGEPHPTFFLSGSSFVNDTGVEVLGETQKNLRICIEEKTRKIARVRHKYPEWWLVLVDRIGYGVDACDQELYREHLKIKHDWDKVIILSPLDPGSAFEVASEA